MVGKVTDLLNRLLDGDKQSLAQLISLRENDSNVFSEIMELIRPRLGKAYRIGVTGPPGAGKSTLINQLVRLMRGDGLSVGIIAVDPSSPVSGGAVLGDRVRMREHDLDNGVFIRSMATRGSRGGLCEAALDVVNLMDAFGMDVIVIETVGVGQNESSVSSVVDTVILVLVPESGDEVQAIKAGILEVADVIVVNKADRQGAGNLVFDLRVLGEDNQGKSHPVVLMAQATSGIGVDELYRVLSMRRSRKVS